jgi:nucleoside-triphosphatase THEP1
LNKRFFITGPPGSGKTTLVRDIVQELIRLGYTVRGFYTPEVRVYGRRKGFYIESIPDSRKIVLSEKKTLCQGKLYAGYCLNPKAGIFIKNIIEDALSQNIVLIIDEIGPMELELFPARDSIIKALKDAKVMVGVVHRRLKDRYPDVYSLITNDIIYDLSKTGRDEIKEKIVSCFQMGC